MVGTKIPSKDLKVISKVLGLTDQQSMVYFTILSAGTSTLGQISQLSGLNYIEVQDALEVLIGSKLVSRIPGKVGRYFAHEPFLKSFLLTYDPITLVTIRNSSKKSLDDLKERLNGVITNISDITEKNGDSNLLTELNQLKEELLTVFDDTQSRLDDEISALTFTIKSMKQRLNFIFDLSRSIDFSNPELSNILTTDLLFGESALVVLLKDLTQRTKSSLLVLMPQPEIQTLIMASKLPSIARMRTRIVGDFRKIPKSTLKKVLDSGVKLRQMTDIDFWACVRDMEELLLCPVPESSKQQELVGITSTNSTLVQFFNRELNSYTTKGRDLSPSDLT